MESDEEKAGSESPNTIGCGLLTLLGGVGILSLYVFDVGTGRGPIGAGAAILFGAILVLAGLYRIAAALISKGRRRP